MKNNEGKKKRRLVGGLTEPWPRQQPHAPQTPETDDKADTSPGYSLRSLKLLFDLALDGCVLCDPEGNIVYANKMAAQLAGCKRGELIGSNFAELGVLSPEQMPRAAANLAKRALREPTEPTEYILSQKDGSQTTVEARTFPLRVRGKPLAFSVIRDVTRSKLADEALRESEERYHSLVEDTHVGIVSTDSQGRFMYVNNALCRMTGYSSEELAGRPFADFLHPDDKNRILELFQGAATSPRATIDLEFRAVCKNGQPVHMYASPTVVRRNGTVLGFNSVIVDISERKGAEALVSAYEHELRSLASRLSLAEERERRRIAVDVHDRVGQTLADCLLKLGTLQESASSTHIADRVAEVRRVVARLVAEVRSLTFELSSPLLYQFGLGPAVQHLAEQMGEKHHIKLGFEDDNQPKPLDNDVSVLLFQAVRELLANIGKHAQASRARVSLKTSGNELHVIVEDDGVGFDKALTLAERGRVKGFGLFSVRERLKYVGGRMEIEADPGHGTRITLVAPLNEQRG